MTTTRVKEQMMSLTITPSNVKKAVKSYTMSKRYINTMLRATIINILYHRLNVEDREFVTKVFNKVPFKTFKSKSKNQLIRECHTYMTACKDAIEKNYLREFYLYFIDSSSNDIVENYKFSFNYSKQDVTQSQNETDLTDMTCELLKNLEDLGRHSKLEANVQVKVEFTYFEETPEDYEPPGFRGVDESKALFRKLNKRGNSVTIGALFTGFHTLKCRGRGEIFNFETRSPTPSIDIEEHSVGEAARLENFNAEDEVVPIENYPEAGQTENENENEKLNQNEIQNIMTEDLNPPVYELTEELTECSDLDCYAVPTVGPSRNLNETYMSQCIVLEDDSEEISNIDCPCKLPLRLGEWSPDIITCAECNRTYHAPCQGYLDKTFLGPIFKCSQCKSDNDSLVKMLGGQLSEPKPLYRIRYIVGCVYALSKMPKELQSLFQETSATLKLTVFDKSLMQIKGDMMHYLFKFDYKKPDKNKVFA